MTKQRAPRDERLIRFRSKDAVLDGLLRGDLLAPSGSANDERLMTILLYRCFKMDEVIAIMAPWPHGDKVGREMQGARYWHWLRRKILAIGEFQHASRARAGTRAREIYPAASGAYAGTREQAADQKREK